MQSVVADCSPGAETRKSESLFIAADIHALGSESRLSEVLRLVARDPSAVQPSLVLLGGDYVGRGRPPSTEEERLQRWQPVFSLAALHEEITAALGREVKTLFTYASHDKNALGGIQGFFCGPYEAGDYDLYGLSFCQMRFASDVQMAESGYDGADAALGSAQRAVAAFRRWESEREMLRPLFVLSHLPLHAHRGDNRAAALWCEALNEAGQRRDVFVFFAHNHTTERRTAYDRRFYLVPKGARLPVQGEEKELVCDMPISFTYLNAGYILHGCGTLLTLSDQNADGALDHLSIRRYALSEEERSFGDAGIPSPYQIQGEWL